jgi:hypothetical protein
MVDTLVVVLVDTLVADMVDTPGVDLVGTQVVALEALVVVVASAVLRPVLRPAATALVVGLLEALVAVRQHAQRLPAHPLARSNDVCTAVSNPAAVCVGLQKSAGRLGLAVAVLCQHRLGS